MGDPLAAAAVALGEAPALSPEVLLALGLTAPTAVPHTVPSTVPPRIHGVPGVPTLPADIQQKLTLAAAAQAASKPLEGPPAKIAKTGPDFSKAPGPLHLDPSLASLAAQLTQPAPMPPQLAQLAPQLARLQPQLQLPPVPTVPAQPSEAPRAVVAATEASAVAVATLSSHRCAKCEVEGKLSIYCVSCGACGSKCAECGETAEVGALDSGNNLWYCKACWIKNTPEGVEGPFTEDDQAVQPSSKKNGETGDGDTVAAPSANDSAKKAHWAQVFATLQQVGQSHQALEYAQSLRKLRGTIQELFAKYKEALASEDELLQTAYTEALDAYKKQQEAQEQAAAEVASMGSQNALLLDAAYKEAIDLQVQAHQEVEAHAMELQKAVQGAHQKAAVALAAAETRSGRPPAKLPRRPGQQPCKFYMRTGDCAYGATCKWDHPERAVPKPGALAAPLVGLAGNVL